MKANILDCTIRDGSYVIDFQWKAGDIKDIVSTLANSGIKYIEIGNGTGLGVYRKNSSYTTDKVYIESSMPYKKNSLIGAFFISGNGSFDDLLNFKEEGGDFIRIGTDATNPRNAIASIEYAKSIGFYVCCNLMKTYAINNYQLAYISNDIVNAGADCIYVVDSAGGMLPNQVSSYVSSIKKLYDVEVGFHGHNNFLLANANSLAAIESGATLVDSSLMCLGRGAGNAQTESLLAIMQKAGYVEGNTDIMELSDFGQNMISKITKRQTGMTKRDIIIGFSNFHDSNMCYVNLYAEKFGVDKEELIKEVSKINIVNPSEELFAMIAEKLSEGAIKNVYFPRYSHKSF